MRLVFGIVFSIFILALAACAGIARRSGKQIGFAAFILLAALILPMAGDLIIIISGNRSLSVAGWYLFYLGMDLSMAALLHFTYIYCRITHPRKWLRNMGYGLLMINVIQLLLNPLFHHAFAVGETEMEGLPYYQVIPDIGQQFHRAVVYILLAGIVITFAVWLIRAPKLQKERFSDILLTLVVVSGWETVYIFSGEPIDRSMIGFGVLGLLIFYFSIYYRPMRLLDRMFSGVVSEQSDPMFFFDDDQKCIWMNTAGQRFLNLEEQETDRAGNMLEEIFGSRHPGAAQWKDRVALDRGGESRHIELSKIPLYDSNRKMNGFYILVHDLTDEERETAEKLYSARRDRQTDLYNKDYLYERTRELLAEHPEEPYLVFQLEISDLQVINDLYGNSFGDYVLKYVAEWLRSGGDSLGEGTAYGRMGGDSFGVCVPEKHFSARWLEEQLTGFSVRENAAEHRLLIHVGVYKVTDRSMSVPVMYDRAMLALESIKGDYRFHIAWYDDSMRERVVWNRQISGELGAALKDDLIRPWLQPVVDREGKTVGAEALVRWIHPEDGIRMPGTFIPVFEKNGMIAETDRFIWRKSCEILARWKRLGMDLFISVNISPEDFYLMNVPSELMKLVLEYGIEPGRLRLEITESVMMKDQEARMDMLRRLEDAGFVIEMDDFGSGYSSLNLLREMPVDVLKIDMMFLQKGDRNMRARTIIDEIITLTGRLGITSLTEGVETKEQFDSLKEMGCRLFQGYYFAKPMPLEDFERYLADSGRQT